MTDFTKSKGLTPSEQYLAHLCERSFLSFWSYPNVYREPGKELCDNLVVFRNHVIIFSDKSCRFPDTGNVDQDWRRWFKHAVQHSARQVYGAERWLRERPGQLFIDAKCTRPFPITLPDPKDTHFHRIVVALNASQRCVQFFGNSGSGSLMLRPDVVGDDHFVTPFTIGRLHGERGYVHVFDDVTLNIVLKELDTISDFTRYLARKETMIGSGRLLSAAGEEELLAHYLTHVNAEDEHDFVFPDEVDGVSIAEGFWASLATDPRYAAKKAADRPSYAWDELIEKFNKHAVAGTLAISNEPLSEFERGVRELAGESRLSRRLLVTSLFDLLARAPDGHTATRLILCKQDPERAFQFLISAQNDGEPDEAYRERRVAVLAAYCHVAKVRYPHLLDITGLATEPLGFDRRSEDLVYLNARQWTQELEESTRELQAKTGILMSPRETHFHDDEYPELHSEDSARADQTITTTGNRKQRRARLAELRRSKRHLPHAGK